MKTNMLFKSLLLLALLPLQALALTEQEITDLKFMREEEKLAYDLYNRLYDLWGNTIFSSIAVSEARHKDSVLNLLNQYGIADPAAGYGAGEYSNSAIQALYDQLLADGSVSELAALQVGVLVEETDIDDLDAAIANTSNSAIIRVYSNLRKGSLNHLSAFSNQVEALGGTGTESGLHPGISVYEPISQTLYIPAINVTGTGGSTAVYDALLRMVETVPQTLQLVSANLTDKTASDIHATYTVSEGIVRIPILAIGALNYSSLEANTYVVELQFQPELSGAQGQVFSVKSLVLITDPAP
jgi:hypothetical protein